MWCYFEYLFAEHFFRKLIWLVPSRSISEACSKFVSLMARDGLQTTREELKVKESNWECWNFVSVWKNIFTTASTLLHWFGLKWRIGDSFCCCLPNWTQVLAPIWMNRACFRFYKSWHLALHLTESKRFRLRHSFHYICWRFANSWRQSKCARCLLLISTWTSNAVIRRRSCYRFTKYA